MRYNKYHWLAFTISLLVICLLASAEKKGDDDATAINISTQDRPDSEQQIIEEVESESQPVNRESTLSVARAGSELNWQVVSTGGNKSISGNQILNGTIGQTAIFYSTSGKDDLWHGYWQPLKACDCEPGEADGTPPINILDIVYLINYKYKNGPASIPYLLCSGDPNLDCIVNILDIIYLINFKYKDGPPPGSCRDWVLGCSLPLRD